MGQCTVAHHWTGQICHPPVNRTLLSTHTTTVISGIFFYCREMYLLTRAHLLFFGAKWWNFMESIVLGSGRGCHAGSLGFEHSFKPAFLAYYVTAFPCGLCVCLMHSSSSNFLWCAPMQNNLTIPAGSMRKGCRLPSLLGYKASLRVFVPLCALIMWVNLLLFSGVLEYLVRSLSRHYMIGSKGGIAGSRQTRIVSCWL